MALSVTEVEFFHLKKKGKVKAFATVTFNNVLTIKNFKIVEGDEGLFVGKPSAKGSDDKWYDNVFVKSKEAWKAISDAIIAEYESSDGENTPRKKRRDDDEDDTPRKSKPNNRRDREEDEEPPKKKRNVEEDEEEDPKPKKKIRKPTEDEDDDLFN